MVQFLYLVAWVGSVIGGLTLLYGIAASKGAPQEAAAAAMAIAFAVIPYVFARCVQLTKDHLERLDHQKKLIALLEKLSASADAPGRR